MKVLCMAETLGRGGGAEQLIFALAPYFKALGVEVHYLSLFPYADDLGVVMEAQGHRVFRAEIERPWHLLEASRRIRSVVRLEDYDVLWGHLYFGNLYANLLNLGHRSRKVVISLHSEGYAQQAQLGFKDRVITMLEKALCGRADAKYAVSSAVKVDYERFFGWSGLGIIHNGVDVSAIATPLAEGERMAIRRSHGVGEGEFLVVVPARFVKKKGHTYLIRAIRVLMGEGILVKAYFASAQGPERARSPFRMRPFLMRPCFGSSRHRMLWSFLRCESLSASPRPKPWPVACPRSSPRWMASWSWWVIRVVPGWWSPAM